MFTDRGNHAVALHVRRGIAVYIPVPDDYLKKSDFVLQMDSKTSAELYLSALSLEDTIGSGKVKLKGDKAEMVKTFDMFDQFKPTKNYVVPPIED